MINKIHKSINNFFKLQQYQTTIKTEVLAGLTTYISTAYILFVNPLILSNAGMDIHSLFTATALAIVFGTTIMALFANLPIVMAPGMGSNGWFAFTVVLGLGFTWQQGLAAVFLGGIFFIIFTATKLRVYLISAFSSSLKYAIGSGIGIFIASVGLKTGGIIASTTATIITLGSPFTIPFIMTIIGVLLIAVLEYYKVIGSLLISVFILSIIGIFLGQSTYTGIISSPPSISPTFFQMDFSRILEVGFIAVAMSVFLMDFLDSTGAFMSLMTTMNKDITDSRVKKALFVDGIATPFGAILGTSTNSPFIESSSGISKGGRTGLTAIVVAVLFALSLMFSPILSLIPSWATAPILIYIGSLMFRSVMNIKWHNVCEGVPAFITIIIMPLTSSIAHGIGLGVISWIVINILAKQFSIKKHAILLIIAIGYIFILNNM